MVRQVMIVILFQNKWSRIEISPWLIKVIATIPYQLSKPTFPSFPRGQYNLIHVQHLLFSRAKRVPSHRHGFSKWPPYRLIDHGDDIVTSNCMVALYTSFDKILGGGSDALMLLSTGEALIRSLHDHEAYWSP